MPAAIATVAALAAPCGVLAQGKSPFVAQDEQLQLLNAIQSAQTEEGPYARELLDPLKTLSVLYQEGGDHLLAVAALERAMQVVRANYGLRSLEQAPLIRQQIVSQRAIGNVEAAWELEQELLGLVDRHPEDVRIAPILREIGDSRMSLLERYLGGEIPAEIYLGCYYDRAPYDDFGSCHAGSRGQVVFALLSEAWGSYSGAIDVLLRNELYESDELRQLESEIVSSAYAFGGYGVGRASFRRVLENRRATGAPFVDQIEALVQLADWDLIFVDARGAPLGLYEHAYEQLKSHGVEADSIDRIFSPDVPIVLPTNVPNPLAATEANDASRHIDVAFELTKFGKSREIEILGATGDATDEEKQGLVKLIARSRFRPQLSDGQFERTEPLVVRYYLPE